MDYSNYKIDKNFLDNKTFYELQTNITANVDWWYRENLHWDKVGNASSDPKYQFIHLFYLNDAEDPQVSDKVHYLKPLLEKLSPHTVLRIKANLTTKTEQHEYTDFHTDYSPNIIGLFNNTNPEGAKCYTSIFYVNSSNGFTQFQDGPAVESIENSLLTFPTFYKHCGVTCTDSNTRIVININYLK